DHVYTALVTVNVALSGTFSCTVAANDIVRNEDSVVILVVKDDSPPIIRRFATNDPDTTYRNREIIEFQVFVDSNLVDPGEPGLTITADFSRIDDNYHAGAEVVSDDGAGTYTITYTISWNNSQPDANDLPIRVVATDGAGNFDIDTWYVSLDNEGPTMDSLAIADLRIGTDSALDQILNDNDTFTAVAKDAAQEIMAMEYFVDVLGNDSAGTALAPLDGAYNSTTETTVGTLDITSLAEGLHTLYVHAQDTAGNWGEYRSETFIVDRIGPEISNVTITYPGSQTTVAVGDTITITADVRDATTRVDTVWVDATALNTASNAQRLFDDGTNGDAVAGDHVYTALVTVNVALSGTFSCTVAANDIVRNEDSVVILVVKDDSPPIIRRFATNDPDTRYRNGQTITFQVFIDSNLADPGEVGLTVTADFSLIDAAYHSGAEIVSDDGGGTYTISYTISEENSLSDRTDSPITVRATDGAGNFDTEIWRVSLDNSGPTMDSLVISDLQIGTDSAFDQLLNDNDTFIAVGVDATQTIAAMEYFIDVLGNDSAGTAIPPLDGAFDSARDTGLGTLDLSPLDEGLHTLYVHAQDTTGNWGAYAAETFIVDRVAPKIQDVRIDLGGETFASDGETVTIEATVWDVTTEVDTVYLDATNLNGNPFVPMLDNGKNGDEAAGDDVYTAQVFVSTGRANGETVIRIYAADIVVNTGVRSDSVFLVNAESPVIQYVFVDDVDTVFANGQTIRLEAYVTVSGQPAPGLTVTADFLQIDTTYIAGAEVVADDQNGTYAIRYTIAENNTTPNSDSLPVIVTARSAFGADSFVIYLALAGSASGDIVDPYLAELIEPDSGSSVRTTVRLRARAGDTAGLDRVEFWRVDPTGDTIRITQVELSGETEVQLDYTWDVQHESEGIHQLFVIAYDQGGNSLTSPFVTLQIDRTAPDSFSVVVENISGIRTQVFTAGETIVIIVTTGEVGDSVTADFSAIDSEYQPGDEQPFLVLGNGVYEIDYRISPSNTRVDGTYVVPVTVSDSAGNTATKAVAIRLQSPTARTLPSPNPFVEGVSGRSFVAGDLSTGILFRPMQPGATLEIFTLGGRLVQRLTASGGQPYVHWDVRNTTGRSVASGYYIYVVRNPNGSRWTGKVAIVR
ncbi:MAG: hypothetical protein D6679_09125, partial [Candidatus Hydrogenedentota bacterium]